MNGKNLAPKSLLSVVLVVLLCIAALLLSSCNKDTPASSLSDETTEPVETQTTATTATTALTTPLTTVPPVSGSFTTFPAAGWCNADTLRVRSGPGLDYNGIGGLKYGEQVTVLGQQGDWFQIKFKDGVAYVSAQYIQSTEPSVIITTPPAATTTTAGGATKSGETTSVSP